MNLDSLCALTPCQADALDLLKKTSDNIFVTGGAGSGKSFLMRRFLTDKDRKFFPIVASTGAAAVLVGGRTFHSFFGLGIMEGGVDKTVERALGESKLVKRLQKIEGFVLDEVSMISGSVLATAEMICRKARKQQKPWGGARVIAVGDFAQLPPVAQYGTQKDWAFLNEVWDYSDFKMALLKTIARTKDPDYIRVLNFVRAGDFNDEVELYLNRRTRSLDEVADIPRLLPKRDMADRYNQERLSRLKTTLRSFKTEYTGQTWAIEQLKKNSPIPEILHLKEGALVMIRVNDPLMKYVNGSLGTVLKMDEEHITIKLKSGTREVELEVAEFSVLNADGNRVASAKNFPLTLSYATTIHKAQGSTMDEMVCDLRGLWEPGQAYVALSRLRSGDGLNLMGWDKTSFRVDSDVTRFYEGIDLVK